jgi:hypothetical protein
MKHLLTCAFSLLLLWGAAAPGGATHATSADQFPSGIAGRLTDLNGAVIVGAKVRIITRSTKKVFSLETDSGGEYVADLDPDVYDVEAEAAGFKKARRKYIPVAREGRSYVDFVMRAEDAATDPRHP